MALDSRLSTIWRRRTASPLIACGTSGATCKRQVQAFFLGHDPHDVDRRTEGGTDVQGLFFELQVTGFDLGEVQNVVDHGQQLVAGYLQHAQQLLLGRVQRRFAQQFAHAHHAVQRRADFMAHHGEKTGFGPDGGQGLFAG